MFRIKDPDKVKTVSVFNGKVFHVEPGSLVIDGDILRFRLNRSAYTAQVHMDEVSSIVSEDG